MYNKEIIKLRKKIDIIDKKIIRLLDYRLNISIKISKEKEKNNQNIYDPIRERDIITKLCNTKRHFLSNLAIKKIYKEILHNSVNKMNNITKLISKENKMDIFTKSLKKDYDLKGKLEIKSRIAINNIEDLSIAYTPGVAKACQEIQKDESLAYQLTRKSNTVAVITDGSAVLGLGDIGPSASMPVMEGKCILFKELANIDAIPICINSKNIDEIVKTIYLISKSFGGINLEDISAPRCFEIEKKLKEMCDIPIFRDDQHGTAIVTAAAIKNALKIVNKKISNVKIVISGAGAAGTAIAHLLIKIGFNDIILCDKNGIISQHNDNILDDAKKELAKITNKNNLTGSLSDALNGADVFIGVSAPNIVSEQMIKKMNKDAIVLALANPTPEIMPELAKKAGARIVGTGRSDFPNQINNILAFPGLFKGVLSKKQREITDEIKIAAMEAIANMISDEELSEENILPHPLDRNVPKNIAQAIINL